MSRLQTDQFKITLALILLLISACASTGGTTATPSLPTLSTVTAVPVTPFTASTPNLEGTITPHPTWTPLPTLPSKEAITLAEELYATNAGCRLPCWWGITPGLTTWEEARHFFDAFATEIIGGDSIQITERGVTYFETRYIVRYAVEGDSPVGGVGLYVINGVISSIQMGRLRINHTIQLHQMLAEYGPPTQIFLWTLADVPGRPLPFTLVLFYEDLGILAKYTYDNAERIDDVIQSCPKPVGIILWLWSQIIEMDFEDIELIAISEDPPFPLKPLEEITDYTIESFYQTFKDAQNETCIVTLVEHWE